MSILDDAIREHLELKRAHGADEAELKKLEDEAFGPPGRPDEPDPFAEAQTEFMTTPEAPEAAEPAEEEDGRRRINIADLQEPPSAETAQRPEEPRVESAAVEPEAGATLAPAEDPVQAAPPAEEESPAMEHEIVAEPAEEAESTTAAETEASPAADERHAIAEQPTELFDIEAEMGTEDAPAATEPPTEIHASRTAAPQEPLAEEDDEDEEFWNEQRLSDELDQALEAPLTDEHEIPGPSAETAAPVPTAEPVAPVHEVEDEADETTRPDYDPDTGHEDVLEDTPDFLEDAPEDDELWFEQKPPKDFDLD